VLPLGVKLARLPRRWSAGSPLKSRFRSADTVTGVGTATRSPHRVMAWADVIIGRRTVSNGVRILVPHKRRARRPFSECSSRQVRADLVCCAAAIVCAPLLLGAADAARRGVDAPLPGRNAATSTGSRPRRPWASRRSRAARLSPDRRPPTWPGRPWGRSRGGAARMRRLSRDSSACHREGGGPSPPSPPYPMDQGRRLPHLYALCSE
jgi:hypothetical protein